MRRPLIQLGALVILLICISGHVSELFDQWDHTLQTGREIDYSTVIVVLVAGAVIVAALHQLLLPRRRLTTSTLVSSLVGTVQLSFAPSVLPTPSPPPIPLRI